MSCSTCNGTGKVNHLSDINCGVCHGTGADCDHPNPLRHEITVTLTQFQCQQLVHSEAINELPKGLRERIYTFAKTGETL